MFPSIEKSGLAIAQYDSTSRLEAFHTEFGTKLSPVNGQYFRVRDSFSGNVAHWLGLPSGLSLAEIHTSVLDSLHDMYYGKDIGGNRTLGLQEIHNWKREGDYKDINTKQQAGFAAEVISTAKENLIAQYDGTGITTRRADDLPELFPKNDQYVDKVRFDASGTIIERIQTKFVGKNGEECLRKLMTKKFDKYIYDGKVDKIEIPKDFYEEIQRNELISARRQNLTKQLERVTANGNTEVAQQLEARIDKLNRVERMLEPSTVTMAEAIEGVLHPTRTTGRLFWNGAKYVGTESAKSGLVSAGITLAVSTADNMTAYLNGEISVDEMVADIVSETAASGTIEFGSELISATVSHAMSKSSSTLIRKIAGSSMPAAVVSFAVESYDSIAAYARNEIDSGELAYELGENAASIAGAIGGAALMGAAVGSVVGPLGTGAGFIVGAVGGVVGAAIASEAYATAVELGMQGAEFIAERAEGLMKDTVELFENHVPEKLDEVKVAFNEYITEFDLPFNL